MITKKTKLFEELSDVMIKHLTRIETKRIDRRKQVGEFLGSLGELLEFSAKSISAIHATVGGTDTALNDLMKQFEALIRSETKSAQKAYNRKMGSPGVADYKLHRGTLDEFMNSKDIPDEVKDLLKGGGIASFQVDDKEDLNFGKKGSSGNVVSFDDFKGKNTTRH